MKNKLTRSLAILWLFLLISFIANSQNFEFTHKSVRDNLGKFIEVKDKGKFSIESDSLFLYDEKFDIISKRLVFDEKGQLTGVMYTCESNKILYTALLTTDNILYFSNEKYQMIRINLTKIEKID